MRNRRARALWATAAVLLTTTLVAPPAAARELHWRELAVQARLDADGRLHVTERHEMVFTGDWNGGERIFDVRLGQDLELRRLARIDPSGATVELRKGSLDKVDHYDWTDSQTLRWRSRRPQDPIFADTLLTYVLDYTLSGILQPGQRSDIFVLDHDFAFPDRQWPIERFRVDLELDPVWEPPAHWRGHHEMQDLPPGRGWVGTWQLVYTGEGQPAGVPRPTARWFRLLATGVALAVILGFLTLLFRREGRLGRLRFPDDLPREPSHEWIEEHLMALPAEQVGALWDRKIAGAEVAGLLARLVAEGKLESEVEPKKRWYGSDILRLRLRAPRTSFNSYERALINKLFFNSRTETDTEMVREHYRSKGFDPVGQIRGGIESAIAKRLRSRSDAPSRHRSLTLFAALVGAFLLEALTNSPSAAIVFAIGIAVSTLPIIGLASALAFAWRDRVEGALPVSLSWLLPGAWTFVAAAGFLFLGEVLPFGLLGLHPGTFGVLGILLVPVLAFSSLTNMAASRDGREAIRRRQELVHIRRYLARELRRERPDLDDRWLPHLIAFGLGPQVTGWGRRWGVSTATGSDLASAGRSSGSLTGGGWTGGGGTFGGAGASAAWAAAATGMAAGVAAPSSSGGGSGGGGGGGSSGGGGGGGW